MAKGEQQGPALTTFDRVRLLMADQYERPATAFTPTTHFYNDLNDSLDLVELVTACEEEFGIDIPDEEAQRIERVGELTALIEEKLQEPRR